jgi:hypothetical protein
VAGFDCTFPVPKSVRTLRAVADAGTQALIVQARPDVAARMRIPAWDTLNTRTGPHGVLGLSRVRSAGEVVGRVGHHSEQVSDSGQGGAAAAHFEETGSGMVGSTMPWSIGAAWVTSGRTRPAGCR